MTATAAPRVLVIDNDQRIGELLTFNLSRRGYEVQMAEGSGATLLEEAVTTANRFRPHIAVVDLRLIDDYVDEFSGLELLPQLQSARCILYSAHLEARVTLKAAQEYHAFAWVDKFQPEDLYAAGQRAAYEACASVRDVTIHWPASWRRKEMVSRLFPDTTATPDISILDDLIAQLFPNNTRFYLETVTGAVNGLPSVLRGRSAVIKIFPDDLEPKVLKIGNANRIRGEDNRYRRYVKDQLPGLHATRLERNITFWDLGAAIYSFIGSAQHIRPTFALHYSSKTDVATVVQPLRHFFQTVWGNHYEHAEPLSQPTLFAAYDEALGLTDRLAYIDETLFAELELHLPRQWKEPVAWLHRFGHDSAIRGMKAAVTHGDLHGDNLFVEGRRAWIIDFERTGPGHALRDFVELEIDIYTRLVDDACFDWHTLLDLALALAAPNDPTMPIRPSALAQENPDAMKALGTIQAIRQLAHELVRYQDQREYLWGLLFDALFLTSIPSVPRGQRLRAMLLSMVICERLCMWGVPWPPDPSRAPGAPEAQG